MDKSFNLEENATMLMYVLYENIHQPKINFLRLIENLLVGYQFRIFHWFLKFSFFLSSILILLIRFLFEILDELAYA